MTSAAGLLSWVLGTMPTAKGYSARFKAWAGGQGMHVVVCMQDARLARLARAGVLATEPWPRQRDPAHRGARVQQRARSLESRRGTAPACAHTHAPTMMQPKLRYAYMRDKYLVRHSARALS